MITSSVTRLRMSVRHLSNRCGSFWKYSLSCWSLAIAHLTVWEKEKVLPFLSRLKYIANPHLPSFPINSMTQALRFVKGRVPGRGLPSAPSTRMPPQGFVRTISSMASIQRTFLALDSLPRFFLAAFLSSAVAGSDIAPDLLGPSSDRYSLFRYAVYHDIRQVWMSSLFEHCMSDALYEGLCPRTANSKRLYGVVEVTDVPDGPLGTSTTSNKII